MIDEKTVVRFSLSAKTIFTTLCAVFLAGGGWAASKIDIIVETVTMAHSNSDELEAGQKWMEKSNAIHARVLNELEVLHENQRALFCEVKEHHGGECEFIIRQINGEDKNG